MLYACDGRWWAQFNGVPNFHGLKVTQDRHAVPKFPGLHWVTCRKGVNDLMFSSFGEIGWGGNGGFHALNLAYQFGARSVVGVGFDMSIDHGLHYHGRHGGNLTNPRQASVDKWRFNLDAQKPILDRMGLEFILGSPNSRLTAYRKLGFMEAVRAATQNLD